jgi:hypothetical protein
VILPDRVEREITAPVDIATPDGRLRREAVGWARHPVHRAAFAPGISRVGRWNYWCITTRTSSLTILIGDVGYLGFVLVSFLELAGRGPVERLYVRPRGLPFAMPESPRGDIELDVRRLRLGMHDRGEELHVKVDARTLLGRRILADLVIERPLSHETINVVVPWDDTHYHLTSKQQALPARGVVRVGDREHPFGPENDAFACLDYGRGRWPRSIHWNWAFASARREGRTIGLNLGGRWTDGTGVTENGFVIDGRVHKISEPVDFTYDERAYTSPWRIRTRTGDRVDLRFVPVRERAVVAPLGIVRAELHQLMGSFSGTFVCDDGAVLRLDDAIGLAESVRGHW